MKLYVLLTLFFVSALLSAHGDTYDVDLIVFSKDRPLQLYAFLESLEQQAKGFHDISVLCHAKNDGVARAYKQVEQAFPSVDFIYQSRENPRADFKRLLCSLIDHSHAKYLIFAVDDIIVIDSFDIQECAKLLEQTKAYGFYLRLGCDITECYMEHRVTGQPHLYPIEGGIGVWWQFNAGKGDWGYPHSLDMTLFRKSDLKRDFIEIDYSSPNKLEGRWSGKAVAKMQEKGLCFLNSKIMNLPLNLVQSDYTRNRNEGTFTADQLLELFERGHKIDVAALHKFPHRAPHVAAVPTFVKR